MWSSSGYLPGNQSLADIAFFSSTRCLRQWERKGRWRPLRSIPLQYSTWQAQNHSPCRRRMSMLCFLGKISIDVANEHHHFCFVSQTTAWVKQNMASLVSGPSELTAREVSMYQTTSHENALITHSAVLEAAVVGDTDADALVKPRAYVVLKQGYEPSEARVNEPKACIKEQLVPSKYPRRIEFLPEPPTWRRQDSSVQATSSSRRASSRMLRLAAAPLAECRCISDSFHTA